jgi:P27 family predicted phage terminase small subunit
MARPKDNPRDQADKGFPGRRKAATQRELKAQEEMDAAAKREAELVATGELQGLPFFLADKKRKIAQAVWKELAPSLDKLRLLSKLDRIAFGRYCVYFDEFVSADRELLKKGYTIMSRSTKGHARPWVNPAASRRDYANEQMLRLEELFGMSPLARYNLIRKHAMSDDEATLFGRQRAPAAPPPEEAGAAAAAPEPPAGDDDAFSVGELHQHDSRPPGKLN